MNPYRRMARISRQKLLGPGQHEGVLLPDGTVAHITDKAGIHTCSFVDFAQGHKVEHQAELHPILHTQALQRLDKLLVENQPYDPLTNNCEIVARKILGESPISPQVLFWVTLTALGALWYRSS